MDLHGLPALGPRLVTRIVITLYFAILAMGYIDGADLARLAYPLLDQPAADYLSQGIVLTLCAMVLFGAFRRQAGIVLGFIVFAAIYKTMFASGDIVGFWRDFALVMGLMWSSRTGADWDDQEVFGDNDLEITPAPAPQPVVENPPVRRRATVSRFREDLDLAQID